MAKGATEAAGRRLLYTGAAVFVIVGLGLKFAMMYLTAFSGAPVPWDSNFVLNIGSNYLTRGGVTYYMWRIPSDSIVASGSGTGFGIFALLFWLKLTGLSLWSGQMLMYLFGVATLPLAYLLVQGWWNDRIAGAAGVVFVVLSGVYFQQYFVRMDAPAIFWYFAVLLLQVRAVRNGPPWWSTVVGLLLGVGLEIHIFSLLWIGAVGLYHLAQYFVERRRGPVALAKTPLAFFLYGSLPALVAYALIHILPDPRAYFLISKVAKEGSHWGLIEEMARALRFVPFAPLESAVMAMAAVAAAFRRSREDIQFLLLCGGFAITMAVVNPPVSVEYSAHGLPLFALGVGRLFSAGAETTAALSAPRLWLGLATATTMVVNLGAQVRAAMKAEREPTEQVDYVKAHVPVDAVVMANPRLFHRLIQYSRFLSFSSSWESLAGSMFRRESYATFLEREHPVVLIGNPSAGHPEVRDYVEEHEFDEVRPDLWIDPELLRQIAAAHAPARAVLEASPPNVAAGECALVHWEVTDAEDVFFELARVPARGEARVCPRGSRSYELLVYQVSGMSTQKVRITVSHR